MSDSDVHSALDYDKRFATEEVYTKMNFGYFH